MNIYDLLRKFGQTPFYGKSNVEGVPMLLGFLHNLWSKERTAKERYREEENYREQENRAVAAEKKERQDRDDAYELAALLLATSEIRAAWEQLQRDINDAIRTVHVSYERAAREKEIAIDALGEVRRGALVLYDAAGPI